MSTHQHSETPTLIHTMDELEAGEVAVELDDKEPQEVLAWSIDRFGNELGICSSFQAEGCAAHRHGAQDRSQHSRVYDRYRPPAAGDL